MELIEADWQAFKVDWVLSKHARSTADGYIVCLRKCHKWCAEHDVQTSTMTTAHHVTRMADRGLVKKETCDSDRRGTFVVVTRRGRKAIEAAASLPHLLPDGVGNRPEELTGC